MTVSTDQPSARLRPQPGHIYVVVDLGGTQTRTAIFDPTGQMLTRRAVATPRTAGPDEVIAALLDQIREATAQHRATVVAVGVSALGPVDPHTGIIHSAPTLPGFDNVPLGPRLHDALQLPVHVHNDATIAEWQLGAGRGTRNFCYVTVSTGMGCGIISNGQLVTGRAYAGELGRTRIPSTDGSTAQLEQISSGTAIAARAAPSSPPAHQPAWPPSAVQASPREPSPRRLSREITLPAASSPPPPPLSVSNSPISPDS